MAQCFLATQFRQCVGGAAAHIAITVLQQRQQGRDGGVTAQLPECVGGAAAHIWYHCPSAAPARAGRRCHCPVARGRRRRCCAHRVSLSFSSASKGGTAVSLPSCPSASAALLRTLVSLSFSSASKGGTAVSLPSCPSASAALLRT